MQNIHWYTNAVLNFIQVDINKMFKKVIVENLRIAIFLQLLLDSNYILFSRLQKWLYSSGFISLETLLY